MGERHDLPKIKPDEKPTIINHEAAKWGWLASFASIPIVFGGAFSEAFKAASKSKGLHDEAALVEEIVPKVKKYALVGLGIQLGAALIGGLNGKQKQEGEQVEGRVVKTPSYWNTGIISGMFVGSLIQIPLNLINIEKNLSKPRGGITSSIIGISAPIIGSIMRKNELQRDFDKSVAIRDTNHAKTQQLLEAAIANQNNPPLREEQAVASFKNSVTPDEAALLMEKQAQATPPVVEKPAHGPEHKPHTDHAAHGDAHTPEHHATHSDHHSEHQGEQHDAPSHAAKHEHQQHAGSHAAKHEPAASHTDHAEKHEAGAGMAMSA